MSSKRQLLIDTALGLFYHKGIHAVGVNEILAMSGIAKKTLYSHFESKNALLMAALEVRHERFMTWLSQTLDNTQTSQQLIEQLFKGLATWFNSEDDTLGPFRGCFFINTSAEFSEVDELITAYCRAHKEAVRDEIARHLPEKNEPLLEAIFVMMEGAIVTAQMTHQGELLCQRSSAMLTRLCNVQNQA
ncbi:TetR/AcrR family transcriptional regulator [Pseudoalteromonas xiamenensis]|uniref:TetR/AcrR family transcriptional regulator n=1 Tax=Pseudoalteromonas xiamenensis TaxID=882626 RepID=UPI0035EF5C32